MKGFPGPVPGFPPNRARNSSFVRNQVAFPIMHEAQVAAVDRRSPGSGRTLLDPSGPPGRRPSVSGELPKPTTRRVCGRGRGSCAIGSLFVSGSRRRGVDRVAGPRPRGRAAGTAARPTGSRPGEAILGVRVRGRSSGPSPEPSRVFSVNHLPSVRSSGPSPERIPGAVARPRSLTLTDSRPGIDARRSSPAVPPRNGVSASGVVPRTFAAPTRPSPVRPREPIPQRETTRRCPEARIAYLGRVSYVSGRCAPRRAPAPRPGRAVRPRGRTPSAPPDVRPESRS